jgi:hypothetical protein
MTVSPAAIGELVGTFAVMIGVAAVWLILCYGIPPLRRRPHVTYIVAMSLAVALALIPAGGPTGASVGAAILCIALLYWQMRRAQRRQLARQALTGA